mmetsp:Transcript_20892/g.35922  ORF Transcript_20892/g.35922 Transcript_20892/m.35922 type:complete len:345 (-) Transcript_20892:24-1058(-)
MHNRLSHPTAGVGSRPVNLSGILSREGSTSMSSPSSICVNDDLASSKASISLGSTNDELSRGVQVDVAIIPVVKRQCTLSILQSDGFQSLHNDVIMDEFVHLSHGWGSLLLASPGRAVVLTVLLNRALRLRWLSMLSRDEDSVDFGRNNRPILELVIGDGDLGLSIGTEPPESSILTDISELLSEPVGKKMRQRHAAFGLIRGVSKHNTLVTSANVHVVLSYVDTSGNIGRLLVDTDKHFASFAGETLRVHGREIINEGAESDLLDLVTDDLLVVKVGSSGDLTEDHDHVVLGGGLACDLGQRIGLQASVEHSIRNLIAELIRVALVDGLGGEEKGACFNHGRI